MNRFFSKLNLSDIKIKAEGNSFPPDADEVETQPVVENEEKVVEPSPVKDEKADAEPSHNGHDAWLASYEETTVEYVVDSDETPGCDFAPTGVSEIVSEGLVVNVGDVLKVSSRSRPSAVAGAIAGVVREIGRAEVQAIGAGATNQAIKAVAIARDYLEESGIEAICVPAFIDVAIENENRTAIRLVVEPR